MLLNTLHFMHCSFGAARCESVMKLRERLDDLGKMMGITNEVKGK